MKRSIQITSLCLVGCLYATVGLADDKKAIWGTDGQAITKKPIPVQTIKPKTEAQINPKQNINSWGSGKGSWEIAPKINPKQGMSGMGGMSGKGPTINPKPQTNAMSGMDGMSGKKPQINPKQGTIETGGMSGQTTQVNPEIKESIPAATPINLPKPIPAK